MDEALEKLLENPRVWRGRSAVGVTPGLASGYPQLDRHLPGGGWPVPALTEILLAQAGSGELKLLMPALARLSRAGPAQAEATDENIGEGVGNIDDTAGWLVWIAPPFQPYPPALLQWGIDIARVLVVRPKNDTDTLWAAEQALASGNCAAVLLWSAALNDARSRRLQLAAEQGNSWAVAFRPLKAELQTSAAALRIRLRTGRKGPALDILKNRGGRSVTLHDVLGHESFSVL